MSLYLSIYFAVGGGGGVVAAVVAVAVIAEVALAARGAADS